jgi:hypothetical protein
MSQQVSLGIMAICLLVITLSILVVSVVTALLLLRLRKAVTTLTNKSQPLISQATEMVRTANGVAQTVKLHADNIMNQAENTVDDVSRRVKSTTNILQESISRPVVSMASVMTGVTRGVEVWNEIRKGGGNGHANR